MPRCSRSAVANSRSWRRVSMNCLALVMDNAISSSSTFFLQVERIVCVDEIRSLLRYQDLESN